MFVSYSNVLACRLVFNDNTFFSVLYNLNEKIQQPQSQALLLFCVKYLSAKQDTAH